MNVNNLEVIQQSIDEITSLARGFMPAQILLTANRLDLFNLLSEKKLTARDLANKMGTNARATELLCNALVSLGFLEKKDGKFYNSEKSEQFLVRGKPYFVGDNLRHQSYLMERWLHLEEVIKTGQPLPRPQADDQKNKQQIRDFILAMANIGQLTARQVVEGLDLRGVQRIIDIGGGPATYAIEFVKKNPDIQAVVFDLPEVVPIAEERIRALNLQNNISTKVGNFHQDDLGVGYDLAFLSNIIHMLGFEEMIKLFKKIHKALNQNGKLVVKDFFVNEAGTAPSFAAQFAINMLINTEHGKSYSFTEMHQAFDQSDFSWIYSFSVGHHSTVIVAERG
ncbi:MAG: methyltransferase [Calditrichaeota bacterium]|nr:MAG: methyltransferase [Calditrichota bacterium]